ncbi:MAG: hypothetical protein ACE5HJ_04520 [Thermoplasmata archaeon]
MASPEVLPWIAVRSGMPLSPTGISADNSDLGDLIALASKEHGRLLFWDVDGMERGKPQLPLYRQFEGKGLWIDAGVRNMDALIDVLVAGGEVAVLNMKTLPRLEDLSEAGRMTEKLALCVEEGEEVLVWDRNLRGLRPFDLFKAALQAGIKRGVYLRHRGLQGIPEWAETLEDMEFFAGPRRPTHKGRDQPKGAVVDLYELI